jgi:hypothetical protein
MRKRTTSLLALLVMLAVMTRLKGPHGSGLREGRKNNVVS